MSAVSAVSTASSCDSNGLSDGNMQGSVASREEESHGAAPGDEAQDAKSYGSHEASTGDSSDADGSDGASVVPECTVLIADDVDVNQRLLTRWIELSGIPVEVLLADDGEEAVSAWRERREDIDLIMMDINMPLMNGIEATDVIRSEEAEGEHVTIYAISANVTTADQAVKEMHTRVALSQLRHQHWASHICLRVPLLPVPCRCTKRTTWMASWVSPRSVTSLLSSSQQPSNTAKPRRLHRRLLLLPLLL